MRFTTILIFVVGLLFISCGEGKKDSPEAPKQSADAKIDKANYTQTILPSLIGYIYETYNGIGNIISHELKKDNKSTFIALVYQKADGKIQSVNFHFEGNYNNTELTINHPFLVLCNCDKACDDCRFTTNEENQVMCGCNKSEIESPCDLEIDHITDFDFYANYHDLGLEISREFGIK
ncbi:hypothetical protein MASR1M45_05830 [Candidatus Kapaibacterium sp.]